MRREFAFRLSSTANTTSHKSIYARGEAGKSLCITGLPRTGSALRLP